MKLKKRPLPAFYASPDIIDHGMILKPLPAEENRRLFVWVGDGLVPRHEATMSVFDSTVQGGDAVWEGLRIYDGR